MKDFDEINIASANCIVRLKIDESVPDGVIKSGSMLFADSNGQILTTVKLEDALQNSYPPHFYKEVYYVNSDTLSQYVHKKARTLTKMLLLIQT